MSQIYVKKYFFWLDDILMHAHFPHELRKTIENFPVFVWIKISDYNERIVTYSWHPESCVAVALQRLELSSPVAKLNDWPRWNLQQLEYAFNSLGAFYCWWERELLSSLNSYIHSSSSLSLSMKKREENKKCCWFNLPRINRLEGCPQHHIQTIPTHSDSQDSSCSF